ncbi:hypothetical protein [Kribbella sp. NPDC004875]|uniref:hypothetical protein n=1 Tax=Kribbella sp. NPDC004875 TaxID=3364107 RepID=UPI0036BD95C8
MADVVTKIVISGKLSYEDEITVRQAARIVAFLNADEGDAESLDDVTSGESPPRDASKAKGVQSPREAIDVSGAKKNPEKIVALGAYVLQDGGETFKAEDVKAQFRRARETAPGNFSRDLSAAVAAGWIAEDTRGEYYLTNKAKGIFDGDFSFTDGPKSRSPRKAAKVPKAKTQKPDVFAEIDEFQSTMEGFPAYSKMKTNKDKLLWVVLFSKLHSIKGLVNKDIEWLTDHIGDGVPNGQITAAFNSAKSAGYANRSTQDQTIRITEAGQTYLASLGSAGK